MASLSTFSAVAALKTSSGQNASGLCSDDKSQSGVGVQGTSLSGLQIKVTRNDNNPMVWTGTLSTSTNDQGQQIADLTCSVTGTDVGTGKNLGDPQDVSVNVYCGVDLSRRVDAQLLNVTVLVGPAA
jgi:hypothetical protein